MLFKDLIDLLQKGKSSLIDFNYGNNPNIVRAASIEKAIKTEISFLDKDSYMSKTLANTNASSILIPNIKDFKTTLNSMSIPWACFYNPKLAFAETLEILNPKKRPYELIHESSIIGNNVLIDNNVYIINIQIVLHSNSFKSI